MKVRFNSTHSFLYKRRENRSHVYLALDSTFAARGDSWRCIGGGGGDALGRGTAAGTSGGISGGVFALVGGGVVSEAGRGGRFLSLLDDPSCSAGRVIETINIYIIPPHLSAACRLLEKCTT